MVTQSATRSSDLGDEAFLRTITFPEEDRAQWTTVPWRGEYRWFRSPNIVPLERFRVLNLSRKIPPVDAPKGGNRGLF